MRWVGSHVAVALCCDLGAEGVGNAVAGRQHAHHQAYLSVRSPTNRLSNLHDAGPRPGGGAVGGAGGAGA
jgi:hypothetical protein